MNHRAVFHAFVIVAALGCAGVAARAQTSPTPEPCANRIFEGRNYLVCVAPPKGDLCLFVAKQLLELAQLKKEMCPITAEEYITGQTAVMPCGHLFMQMAIEETFKKEPNKCPACRQLGRPTFV